MSSSPASSVDEIAPSADHIATTSPVRFANHPAYRQLFLQERMTFGFVAPLTGYRDSPVPDMRDHLALAKQADKLGIDAIWIRDVPLLDPNFGDAGQVYDTLAYLGFLAGVTENIALGTAAVVLPLRSPVHVAKAAATVDQLSGGRLILGVASGDRPIEYPAFAADFDGRAECVRESIHIMRRLWGETFPEIRTDHIQLSGTDVLPKPIAGDIPVIISGFARQEVSWIAAHTDGWLQHPHPLPALQAMNAEWRRHTSAWSSNGGKPFSSSLLIDLAEDVGMKPQTIPLGYRLGREALVDVLREREASGIRHLLLSLRFSQRPGADVLQEFAEEVMPHFSSRN